MRYFDRQPLSSSGRHWRHSRDKMDQAIPRYFCILQAIKNWMVGARKQKVKLKPEAFKLQLITHLKSGFCKTDLSERNSLLSRLTLSYNWK